MCQRKTSWNTSTRSVIDLFTHISLPPLLALVGEQECAKKSESPGASSIARNLAVSERRLLTLASSMFYCLITDHTNLCTLSRDKVHLSHNIKPVSHHQKKVNAFGERPNT
ncbi:hypothetical protein Y032_0533g3048 [Ancylostoma ceylanicum]|uniref:Uncharacterized protein n=1 Tax=Ancylostoma ceylanicum TaxID=53326 RepID=A0A016WRC7_9BILA|nr:hypothetical protein Y032_0533g3048 [Ancylostoma ceylanicum]